MYIVRRASREEISFLRGILEYQLGIPGISEALPEELILKISRNTGRIREVLSINGEVLATILAPTYTFNIRMPLARRIHSLTKPLRLRVVVADEVASDVVSYGNTVFSKHVISVDEHLRAGEEALVTDESDNLLCIGRLLLSPEEILHFIKGPALKLRECVSNG